MAINGDTLMHSDVELMHYGVLGMKWGVRRGKTQKAYKKASKKLDKLNTKVEKAQLKANKMYDKALKKQHSFFSTSVGISASWNKQKKYQAKTMRRIYKAEKWYKNMKKVFSNTDIKLTTEQVSLGESYTKRLNMSREMAYYSTNMYE